MDEATTSALVDLEAGSTMITWLLVDQLEYFPLKTCLISLDVLVKNPILLPMTVTPVIVVWANSFPPLVMEKTKAMMMVIFLMVKSRRPIEIQN